MYVYTHYKLRALAALSKDKRVYAIRVKSNNDLYIKVDVLLYHTERYHSFLMNHL